jgi:hypothetical protein
VSKLSVFAVLAVVLMGCSKPSGVSYQYEMRSEGPWSIHVVKFDRAQRDLELRTTLAPRPTIMKDAIPGQSM